MDPAVLRGLEDERPEKRVAALEKLRASVKENNGHFLVGNLKRAFQTIQPLISDSSSQVRDQSTALLCDIIPELAKGDELEIYMPSVLPSVVQNMKTAELREASEVTLKMFVKHTGNLAAVALLLQQHGTRSEDSQMREAAVKFMPLLVQQVDKAGVDSRLLVLALVERLEDPEGDVVNATIKSLLGIRGMLGETARKYIDSLKLSERKPPPSVPMSMTVEMDRSPIKTPPVPSAPSHQPQKLVSPVLRAPAPQPAPAAPERGFGIVPAEMVEALHVEDWKIRAPAVQGLLDLLSTKEDLSLVVPHQKELVELLIQLLDDPNFKISLTSISIIGALVSRLGMSLNKSCLEHLVIPLAEKLADKKIVIRQETLKVLVKLMRQLRPNRMTEMAVQIAAHKNSYVREEIVHLFMLAVIEYGPKALDMQAIVRVFRDGLFDVKDRVRFIAMEAFTLLRSKLGQAAVEQYLVGIGQDVVRPLHARFQDPRTPTVSDSGLIESCFARHGDDGWDAASPVSESPVGGPRNSSSALISQRPRHQSAGTAQHKQIPWKVPTLRSRAGPSGGGRRHRSAAAAIVSDSNSTVPRRSSGDNTPDELMSMISPASCPPEFGEKHGDMFGDETAPPHMSDAWRVHENTDMQVAEAMSGLYSSWEGPSVVTNKTDLGSQLLMGSDTSSWQSLSPTTPSSSIFPNNRYDYGLSSPSPVPSVLPDVEEDSEYASSAHSKEKISLWLPSGKKQQDNSVGKHMVWDHCSAASADSSSWGGEQGSQRDNLRILKSKHKPTVPRRNGPAHSPSARNNMFESSPGLSSLNIGEAALPEMPEVPMPPTRKLTGRLPRKLLKKDGQTPRESVHHENSPRDLPGMGHRGSEVMGMGIEGMSVQSQDVKGISEMVSVPAEVDNRELTPLANPSKTLESCMTAITVDKWDTQLKALTQLRQLAMHHPETLRGNIGQVNKDVLKSCNSLRSNLSKNALRCVCNLFEGLGRAMDPQIDNTVKVMMNKLTEASGFINGEAELVLNTMVNTATDTKVLSALIAHSDHRHPIIRGKSALFIDRCIEKIGANLPATGMLDRVLQVLMQSSSDSSQEARAYGKQAIGRIARMIPNDLDRTARRVLSASQQQKLEQIMADAGKHYSPLPPGRPRGGFRGEKRGAAKEHGNPSGVSHAAGALLIDTVSSRGGRGAKPALSVDTTCDEGKIEQMEECYRLLKSSDWQLRLQAIDRVVEFVQHNTGVAKARVQHLFDHLEPRLSDNNLKVNIRALEALQLLIPSLCGALDTVVLQLVRVVANTVASTNRQVQQLGGAAMDLLFGWTDKGNMIAAMTAAIPHGTSRVKASLLEKLAEVVHEVWVEKPQAVSKSVLPVAFRYVDETKHDVRAANTRLLVALKSFMGDAFSSQLETCSHDCKVKVQEILGSSGSSTRSGTRRTPR